MMNMKVITTEREYTHCLEEIEKLAMRNPEPKSLDGNTLQILAMLIEKYEEQKISFKKLSPIDAIRFRMDELELQQKDLVSIIGSKSKVSEILSGKRPLTLPMIRALVSRLNIPADLLITSENNTTDNTEDSLEIIDVKKYPLKEIISRQWVTGFEIKDMVKYSNKILDQFLAPIQGTSYATLWRKQIKTSSTKITDPYALHAWRSRIIQQAQKQPAPKYSANTCTEEFLKEIARFSVLESGPILVQEYLLKNGIILIIEPSLPKMHVDGCVLILPNGNPVIGMTLRYDRIDYFWFTLIHELSHLCKHLKSTDSIIIDDLENMNDSAIEQEANRLTLETFVPRNKWERTDAFRQGTDEAIQNLAKELRIHSAIIAGRIQKEKNNYALYSHLLGQGKIRILFKEIKWAR